MSHIPAKQIMDSLFAFETPYVRNVQHEDLNLAEDSQVLVLRTLSKEIHMLGDKVHLLK